MNMRITMVMLLRHTGHASITATRFAQLSQKRAYPQGTSANPSRGATKHTSQVVSGLHLPQCVAPHIRPSLSSPTISSPSLSSPAMSTPAKSSVNVQSCNFSVPFSSNKKFALIRCWSTCTRQLCCYLYPIPFILLFIITSQKFTIVSLEPRSM